MNFNAYPSETDPPKGETMAYEYDDERVMAARTTKSTDGLLSLLFEHHDYSIPKPAITKSEVRKIIIQSSDEAEKIAVCVLPIEAPKLTISAIQRVVCQHYGVTHLDLISPRRNAKIVRPRMVGMFLAREMTSHGFPTIGFYFKRDHTTVIHAVTTIAGLVKKDVQLACNVDNLRDMLSA
jgi:chromosomal replication initiation ATPase DnaA